MGVKTVRRMAADILKVGESRVWIDPERLDEVEDAITRGDVRKLIGLGIVRKLPGKGNSRGRWLERVKKRRKGRRRGHGSRKGGKDARMPRKRLWIIRVRAQRRYIRLLREKGYLDRKEYRYLYRRIKGGSFHSLRALRSFIRMMKEGVRSA